MKHPYEWFSPPVQKNIFIVLFIVTLFIIFISFLLNNHLITGKAPGGIISFELAYSEPTARGIIQSWDCTARIYAGISLGLDFLFIAAYVMAIGLGCVLAAAAAFPGKGFFFATGIVLSWVQCGAGLLDCIENTALIQLLTGPGVRNLPEVAFFCAVPKFILTGTGLVYILTGLFISLLTKINKRRT
jgi:hypothetical protein